MASHQALINTETFINVITLLFHNIIKLKKRKIIYNYLQKKVPSKAMGQKKREAGTSRYLNMCM